MSYGYPGSNSQLENHNVTEESFWPSFSDIMMVIVMVFLLVTVAVILNNWALISKLTNSDEAQKAASSLADNRKVENLNLEKKLSSVEQNLLSLNTQFDKEKIALEKTQARLSTAAQTLSQKEQSLASIENKLNALNDKYEAEQLRLSSTNQQLSASEKKLTKTDRELLDIKQQLANKVTIIASLDKKLLESTQLNKTTQASLDKSNLTLEETQTELANEKKRSAEKLEKLSKANKSITQLQASITDLEKEKQSITQTNQSNKTQLDEKSEMLSKVNTELANEKKRYAEEQEKLSIANKSMTQLKASITNLEKEKQSIAQINQSNKTELDNKSKLLTDVNMMLEKAKAEVAVLEKQKIERSSEIVSLKSTIKDGKQAAVALQTDRNTMDEKLRELLVSLKLTKKKLSESDRTTSDKENELLKKVATLEKENLQKTETVEASKVSEEKLNMQLFEKDAEVAKLKNILAESQETAKAIEQTVIKSENSLKSFEVLLTTAEKQITDRDKKIQELTEAQEAGNSQLLSLQGEYDSLDTKYQKLLRPARSSKGKYVASVSYKKVGGKRVIRYRSNPNGSYKTVSKSQLAKSLEALKKKHKENLYVKVVIPKNSGLSYNEAWRFTINLQRKYDYYYND